MGKGEGEGEGRGSEGEINTSRPECTHAHKVMSTNPTSDH